MDSRAGFTSRCEQLLGAAADSPQASSIEAQSRKMRSAAIARDLSSTKVTITITATITNISSSSGRSSSSGSTSSSKRSSADFLNKSIKGSLGTESLQPAPDSNIDCMEC